MGYTPRLSVADDDPHSTNAPIAVRVLRALTGAPARSQALMALAFSVLAAHSLAAVALQGVPASVASNLSQAVAGLVAGFAFLDASGRAQGLARRFWALASTAFFIWAAAQMSFAYREDWLGLPVTQPSWTHFLFRVYGAPLLMALLLVGDEMDNLVGRASTRVDWQQTLDFVQVGILFPFLYLYLYLVPGEAQGLAGLSLWGFLGFSDVENWFLVLAFLARALWSRSDERRWLSAWFLPYLIVYAAGSTFYNYANAAGELQTGDWPDVVFTVSLTVASFLATTWRDPGRPPAPPALGVVDWASVVLPLLTLALAVPMARYDRTVAVIAVSASVACFGARLIITLQRRQRLTEALLASESRYAALVRLAPDAIFVHTAGRITFANPATPRILGFPESEDLVGRSAADFVAPEQREEVGRILGNLGPGSAMRHLVCMRPDGVRVHLDAVGMQLDHDASQSGPTPRLVIARDVTDRQRAATEREALIRDLETKNAELERFTYTVSHDLRSPLITIMGFLGHVENAAARDDLEALRKDVDRIRQAALKMDRLLSDLLDLSRTGHRLSAYEDMSFAEMAQEAVDRVHGRLHKGGVMVEIDPGLPEIRGDRARLLEVVQNLVDNAAKFMGDQPQPLIRIGVRVERGEAAFLVADNGMGIDPRYQKRVFDLFDKLDPRAEGTGVGLALVKRIIELHGGRVWVESAGAGQGSTFLFTVSPSAPPSD